MCIMYRAFSLNVYIYIYFIYICVLLIALPFFNAPVLIGRVCNALDTRLVIIGPCNV